MKIKYYVLNVLNEKDKWIHYCNFINLMELDGLIDEIKSNVSIYTQYGVIEVSSKMLSTGKL